MDQRLNKAYWLPADAPTDDTTNWISADDITTNIKLIEANHVLVVSDSCHSGALSRATPPLSSANGAARNREEYLENIDKRRSRLLLASGGSEPVLDGGGDGRHSIFAMVLLQSLKDMTRDKFTVEELFSEYLCERVAGRSRQVPECNPIRDSGHDGGTFTFNANGASGAAKHGGSSSPS